jgi:hypothetical protein
VTLDGIGRLDVEGLGIDPRTLPPDGLFLPDLNAYVPGTGGRVLGNVHEASLCAGRGCVVHHPSDHSMRSFPTSWRHSGLFDVKPPHMERICPHGVGHPDPDDLAFQGGAIATHGCDGCCAPS